MTIQLKQCNTCQTDLPLKDFFSCQSRVDKRKRYYNHRCRTCSYEVWKPAAKAYYKIYSKKHLQKRLVYKQAWIEEHQRQGKCYRCCRVVPPGALYCLLCYVSQWIHNAVRSINNNKKYKIPLALLKYRSQILQENKLILTLLPGAQGYPNNRLGHKISVRKNPQAALLATNIQWMKHKRRGSWKKIRVRESLHGSEKPE